MSASTTLEWTLALLLMVPLVALTTMLATSVGRRRAFPAVALGLTWQLQMRLLIGAAAVPLGFWRYAETATTWFGVPIEWWLGSSLASGAVALLALRACSARLALPLLVALELVLLWASSPVVVLSHGWALGLAATVALVLVPAWWLADDTARQRHLVRRAWLQSLCFAGLLTLFLPAIPMAATGHSWSVLVEGPLLDKAIMVVPLALPAALYASAMHAFVVQGKGTAYPYDPPKHLVTTGAYAYVANPMQIAICLFLGWWGVVLANPYVSLMAVGALMQYVVFSDLCTGRSGIGASDPQWMRYRAVVRPWIPRLRPWHEIRGFGSEVS